MSSTLLGDPGGDENDSDAIVDWWSAHPNATSAGSRPVAKVAHVTGVEITVAANVADPPPLEQPEIRPCAVIVWLVCTSVRPGLITKPTGDQPALLHLVGVGRERDDGADARPEGDQ